MSDAAIKLIKKIHKEYILYGTKQNGGDVIERNWNTINTIATKKKK